MFDINDNCPKCESREYYGDFEFSHWGSAKLQFLCEIYCEACQFTNEYTTHLE